MPGTLKQRRRTPVQHYSVEMRTLKTKDENFGFKGKWETNKSSVTEEHPHDWREFYMSHSMSVYFFLEEPKAAQGWSIAD